MGPAHARRPRPWREAPAAALAGVLGVLTDIDDTLTRDGRVEAAALAALGHLHDAGVPVIAITGRPMGWSRDLLAALPRPLLAAVVAENGALALLPREGRVGAGAGGPVDGSDGHPGIEAIYVQDEATRAAHAARLVIVAAQVLAEVPGATLARDSAGRVTDIAIDHAEFATLAPDAVARVLALMRAAGMQASVSSIHVNGWFGRHDKWSGAQWIVRRLFDRELADEPGRWIYVGDSTNDQAMFARFPLAVGVANLMHFAAELEVWPAFLTAGERGLGFAEVARALLAARAGAA